MKIFKAVAATVLAASMLIMSGCGNNKATYNKDADNVKEFVITLYPEYAPITVDNFEDLVSDGFYNGLTFHRVVEGFMAQGGDPKGDGTGSSEKTIKGEFSQNGVTSNTMSHQRGVVSMARSQSYDSASSQFFICYGDCSFLDGQYAAFGKVDEDGMKVVDEFLEVERETNSSGELAVPKTPITIENAKIIDDSPDGHPRVYRELLNFASMPSQKRGYFFVFLVGIC